MSNEYSNAYLWGLLKLIGPDGKTGEEGGFTIDTGGPTMSGITLRELMAHPDFNGDGIIDADVDHDGDIDVEDLKKLPYEKKKEYYFFRWWELYGYDRIDSPEIAGRVFSMAANMGPIQGHKVVQWACSACEHHLKADGVLGPLSIAAINDCIPYVLLPCIRASQAGFYRLLAAVNPAKYGPQLNGWLARAEQ